MRRNSSRTGEISLLEVGNEPSGHSVCGLMCKDIVDPRIVYVGAETSVEDACEVSPKSIRGALQILRRRKDVAVGRHLVFGGKIRRA
jgi:hypothetical protein